jgi:hypothetical protein
VQAGFGVSWSPWPMLRFDAGVGMVHKQAREDFYTYTGPLALLAGTWLLGRGQFLLSTFTYEHDGYEGAETVISRTTRRDDVYLAGLTYGLPLASILPFAAASGALRDTLFTANATYLNERSTIENYRYDDWRFTILWTKRFQF